MTLALLDLRWYTWNASFIRVREMTSPTSMQGQDRSLSIPNIHQGQILLEFATAECIFFRFLLVIWHHCCWFRNPVLVDMVNMQLVLRSSIPRWNLVTNVHQVNQKWDAWAQEGVSTWKNPIRFFSGKKSDLSKSNFQLPPFFFDWNKSFPRFSTRNHQHFLLPVFPRPCLVDLGGSCHC